MDRKLNKNHKILVNPYFNTNYINTTVQSANKAFINPLFLPNISPLSTLSMTSNTSTTQFIPAPSNAMHTAVPKVPAIHINPYFIQRKIYEGMLTPKETEEQIKNPEINTNNNNKSHLLESKGLLAAVRPVISRKLVRCSSKKEQKVASIQQKKSILPESYGIIKRKLIRPAPPAIKNDTISTATIKSETLISPFPIVKRFKIDKRMTLPTNSMQQKMNVKPLKRCFNSRFALVNTPNQFAKKYGNNSSALKARQTRMSAMSFNRKLELANINGVLYKLTKNKLQRKDLGTTAPPTHSAFKKPCKPTNMAPKVNQSHNVNGRVIIVRGMKFVMNKKCNKLVRVPTSIETTKQSSVPVTPTVVPGIPSGSKVGQRIDIGGLTYVASKSQNVFICTNNHRNLAHLNQAKHRSVWMLRERMVKSNVPCAIFQRLGKCKKHELGKCSKVHNVQQVAICARFLRGECVKSNCSLSHHVCLSKMPVCKFFLQGFCTKEGCPYLHKKVSGKADICADFLRGFCKMAEQCNKRHEFLCPRIARNEECMMRDCRICQANKRKEKRSLQADQTRNENPKPPPLTVKVTNREEDEPNSRYYSLEQVSTKKTQELGSAGTLSANSSAEAVTPQLELIVETVRRPPLGPLPVFIPLDGKDAEETP